jgi:hypothetical protein
MTEVDNGNNLREIPMAAEFHAPVGAVIQARKVRDFHQYNTHNTTYVTSKVRTSVLDPNAVAYLRAVFAPPESWPGALDKLQRHQAVALVGEPGSGRFIAAVNLLAQAETTPHRLLLDPDDLDRQLFLEPGHGYLLDLDELTGTSVQITQVLDRFRRVLRKAGNPLVVLAKPDTAEAINLDWRDLTTAWQAARPIPVFGQTLSCLLDPDQAANWQEYPPLRSALAEASPSDAARMAHLVRDVVRLAGTAASSEQVGDEVLAAYRNWTDELRTWDEKTKGEPDAEDRRAFLIATAALEGQPAESILAATALLLSSAGMTDSPGRGLAGPGLQDRLRVVHASGDSQAVTFIRPAYGAAVLDWVWADRPQLRRTLWEWLQTATVNLDPPAAQATSRTLLALAQRHRDALPLLKAADDWAITPRAPLASALLAEAATSEELGRAVRRRLYEWATQAGQSVAVHQLVAEVCSGDLADNYPMIALTRLRHLAARQPEQVRQAVISAVGELAKRPPLHDQVLRAIVDWTQDTDLTRASTGRLGFLELASLLDDTGHLLLLPGRSDDGWLSLLATGWLAAFRAEDTRAKAGEVAATWLEASSQQQAPRPLVLQALTGACRNSVDVASISQVAWQWARNSSGPSLLPREEIHREFLDRAFTRIGFDTLPATTRPSTSQEVTRATDLV